MNRQHNENAQRTNKDEQTTQYNSQRTNKDEQTTQWQITKDKQRWTDNTMTIHKGQPKIHKTLHRKLKIDQRQLL